MTAKRRICIACNEDGFGPSAFGYYLVRGIVGRWREGRKSGRYRFGLELTVLNNSAYGFNKSIYGGFPEIRTVSRWPDGLLNW